MLNVGDIVYLENSGNILKRVVTRVTPKKAEVNGVLIPREFGHAEMYYPAWDPWIRSVYYLPNPNIEALYMRQQKERYVMTWINKADITKLTTDHLERFVNLLHEIKKEQEVVEE